MKIFFSASSDVDNLLKEQYVKVIDLLTSMKFTVNQCLFTDISRKELVKVEDFNDVYSEVLKSIDESDIFIADISNPSGGVGYQVYHALYQRKPVVIVYSNDKHVNPSVILRGIKSKNVQIFSYSTVDDLICKLPNVINKSIGSIKVRFNLVLNNTDYAFIESESKKAGTTKTKYLNKLIIDAKNNYLQK